MSSENALKENAVEMCLLFDFYGAMLTQRQQEIFDLRHRHGVARHGGDGAHGAVDRRL